MTYTQQQRHKKLRDNVVKAYNAWETSTDKSEEDKLYSALEKARERCEAFEDKHF